MFGKKVFYLQRLVATAYASAWNFCFKEMDLEEAEKTFNKAIRSVGVAMRWVINVLKMYFATVHLKRMIKVNEFSIHLLYLLSMIFCIFQIYSHKFELSQYIDCTSPFFEKYSETWMKEKYWSVLPSQQLTLLDTELLLDFGRHANLLQPRKLRTLWALIAQRV